MRAWLLIAGAEFTMLRRSAFTLSMGAVLPLALGGLILWAEADTGRAGSGTSAGLLLVTLVTLTAYVSGTTTLASRRQQNVLRRLRGSGASDAAILTAVLTPPAALTLAQALLLSAALDLRGVRPGPLLPAVLAGIVTACALAALTAAFTSAPELAQLTTTPIALAFLGGAFWVARTPPAEVGWAMLLLPGAAITQLTRIAWRVPGADGSPVAVALLLVTAVAAVAAATRAFVWDPRR
ncbi:ABC transporter permease [Actinoplanes hulinensis]|uniref:ABC transporter permease n=1 Tax=Actinoplanes hulinensis TaxID=1144547 RepID=A0ABS7B700_9ACTN|nr:ABC transporter permease [Actinoplanes hulinensis]MBW6436828.1 ABC transporter permease [Actinoplanes hulinensis]